MKYTKFLSFIVAISFSLAAYSQKIVQSSHQKTCQWDAKTKVYKNCTEQKKQCKIAINDAKKRITLTYSNVKHEYYIKSEKTIQGITTFHAMAETGAGSTIVLNSQKKTLIITTKPSTIKQVFYL